MTDPHRAFSGLKALVVGQGSIGRRHARLLASGGADVAIVSAAADGAHRRIEDVPAPDMLDYAVIANDTARHAAALQALAGTGFAGPVLVEKPLFDQPRDPWPCPFPALRVGYNLRLHPVIDALRDALADRTVTAIRMHAGQYLPHWRPGTDHRTGSSARIDQGGGVLRDLSHEIDMMGHLFGRWARLAALQAADGVLDIETDEAWSILFELEGGATATMTLNYHDNPARREYVATTRSGTIAADLIAGTLSIDGEVQRFETERDETYQRLHRRMLAGGDGLCTQEEAMDVLNTIAAIERSSAERTWVAHG